jgi:hypothetical protein
MEVLELGAVGHVGKEVLGEYDLKVRTRGRVLFFLLL